MRPDLTYLTPPTLLTPSTWVTFLSPNRDLHTMSDSDLQAVKRYLEGNQQAIYVQGTGKLVLLWLRWCKPLPSGHAHSHDPNPHCNLYERGELICICRFRALTPWVIGRASMESSKERRHCHLLHYPIRTTFMDWVRSYCIPTRLI
jgi:hypothetical protein